MAAPFSSTSWLEDTLSIFKTGATVYGQIKGAENGTATPPYVAPTPQVVYQPTAPVAAPPKEEKKDNTITIVLVVVGVLVLGAVAFFAFKK